MSNPTWPEGQAPAPDGTSHAEGQPPAEPHPYAPHAPQGWPNPQPANAMPYGPPAQPEGFGVPGPMGEYPYAAPAAPSQPLAGQPFGSGQYPPAQYPPAPTFGQPGAPSQGFPGGYGGTFSRPLPPDDPTVANIPPGQPGASSTPLYGYQGAPSVPLYGQPAAPSTPLYGQPGAPSTPFYGQPAAPSMPMYGQPGQWGPPSQGFPGAAGPFAAPPPSAPRKSRKGLWITLGAVVVLLAIVGSGAAVVVTQLGAPAVAAVQFCTMLKTQNYDAAYGMFSSSLRQQFSEPDFAKGAQTLDSVQGTVTACGKSAASNAYSYSFGASTATVQTDLSRGTAGTLHGVVHLKQENGVWKVDDLDTSLLGVNLNALKTAGTFCDDLKSQDYSSAYTMLVTVLRDESSQSVFTSQAQLHDQIDGNVKTCAVTSIPAGNTDTQDDLMVAVTRSKLSTQTAQVELVIENGSWKINVEDAALFGSDLGPLSVGNQFCADLKKGDYAGAYNLLSGDLKSAIGSQQQFVSAVTPPNGLRWGNSSPDLSTYKVSGDSASYDVSIKIVDPASGASIAVPTTLSFTKQGTSWQISDINFHG